jgi:hypothetical protein
LHRESETPKFEIFAITNAGYRIRGRIISFQQCAINLGILVAFWIQFGTSYIAGEASWRLPMGLQMVVSISNTTKL